MAGKPVLVVQQVQCEGPGVLAGLFENAGATSRLVNMECGDAIPDLTDYRAMVVLGGPMGVYDDDAYPFLRDEDLAIRRALRMRLPFLGVCLGGQLLAKALGAKVKPNRAKEIGFHEVALTDWGRRDPLFDGLGGRFLVYQWHGDTFSIPRGAARLATAPTCTNQAFRHGPNSYAIQFHLETTPDMVKEWASRYRKELESERVPASVAVPADLAAKCAELQRTATHLVSNFLRLKARP